VIHLINVMYLYVVKDLIRILTYRNTLEYKLVIKLNKMIYIQMYVLKDFNMCLCFLGLTFDIYDLYQYN